MWLNYLTEAFQIGCKPVARLQLHRHACGVERGQDFLNIFKMLIIAPWEDNDMIQIHQTKLPYLLIEYFQGSLECCGCFHKLKGHFFEPVCFSMADEGCLVFIFFCHGHLPVSHVGIQCWEYRRFPYGVDVLIYPWNRVSITSGDCFELPLIDLHAIWSVVLRYND